MKLIQHLTILLLTKRCVSIPLQLQHCQFESRLLLEWSNTTHIHFPPILYINTKLLKSNNACRWAVVAALRRAHYCGAKLVRSLVPKIRYSVMFAHIWLLQVRANYCRYCSDS